MSSSPEAAAGHPHGHDPRIHEGIIAHHFDSLFRQNDAMRLGMWLFLAQEILFFGGLFAAYAIYRFQFPEAFAEASRHLELTMGTINTVVLITSSLTVALAIHYARTDKRKTAVACLALTLVFAAVFLVIKYFEYKQHFLEGSLPGKYYSFEEVKAPGAEMYFTLYFSLTGLHGIHVLVGIGVLSWQMWRTWQGRYTSAYYTGLELGGLYWHLVDLIWIFLYPLLYLI